MILVTGGTGFLGAYLVRYLLARGESVRVLHRPSSDRTLLAGGAHRIEWAEGDILDICALEDAMQGVEQVYHCAAMIGFYGRQYRALLQVNRDGTANVVNTALETGVRKLLHVSTISALGLPPTDGSLITENNRWQDSPEHTYYGITKFLAEREVWRGQAEGLSSVIVNPSTIIGAGKWATGTCKVYYKVKHGLPFYPEGINGYVDVRDVARAMILLMHSPIEGERFIVSAENRSYKSYFDEIAETLNASKPGFRLSRRLALWGSRADRLVSFVLRKDPMLAREIALLTSQKLRYDNAKLRQTLDFEFTPTGQTIGQTCGLLEESLAAGRDHAILPLGFVLGKPRAVPESTMPAG